MLETICPKCRQRYPLGQDHTCKTPKLERSKPKAVESDDISKPPLGSNTPKRGRPKTITDMRAYKAEHERKRRARLKNAGANKSAV